MNKMPEDKSSNKTAKTTEIRMGREVPIVKKATSCDSDKDAKCSDKKEELREDRASSLV
jgi:hypothetical protein